MGLELGAGAGWFGSGITARQEIAPHIAVAGALTTQGGVAHLDNTYRIEDLEFRLGLAWWSETSARIPRQLTAHIGIAARLRDGWSAVWDHWSNGSGSTQGLDLLGVSFTF